MKLLGIFIVLEELLELVKREFQYQYATKQNCKYNYKKKFKECLILFIEMH